MPNSREQQPQPPRKVGTIVSVADWAELSDEEQNEIAEGIVAALFADRDAGEEQRDSAD